MKVIITDLNMTLKEVCDRMGWLKELGYETYFEVKSWGEVRIVFTLPN